MTLTKLKRSIHEKIDRLEDQDLLEMFDTMLAQRKDVFTIPEHMKDGIRQGKQDIKNGNIYTMEDLEVKYEKWLKK